MNIIIEYLAVLLRKTKLYKLATNMQVCEDTIYSQINPILENLVLILYYKISGIASNNIEQLKKNLLSAIIDASSFHFKKSNYPDMRTRITEKIFQKAGVKDYTRVFNCLYDKFYGEENEYAEKEMFLDHIDLIVRMTISYTDSVKKLIVDDDIMKMKEWVRNL